jgi:FlaA1/EpsC-like NDP-sugar epimerase
LRRGSAGGGLGSAALAWGMAVDGMCDIDIPRSVWFDAERTAPEHANRSEKNMTEIAGKAAVVTGGGSGVGMGLAKELARQGASVAITDIILNNAQRVADEINMAGGKAVAIHCDVYERDSIRQMKAEVLWTMVTMCVRSYCR